MRRSPQSSGYKRADTQDVSMECSQEGSFRDKAQSFLQELAWRGRDSESLSERNSQTWKAVTGGSGSPIINQVQSMFQSAEPDLHKLHLFLLKFKSHVKRSE